mgnify:CR=1 FL=1
MVSPDDVKPSLILLDARRGRWEFPELKEIALKEYNYWEPEMVLVEAKASGMPLSDELRRAGIPITNYTITYLYKEKKSQNFIRGYHAILKNALFLPGVFLENTYENGKWIKKIPLHLGLIVE